jgi:hypothetical protein
MLPQQQTTTNALETDSPADAMLPPTFEAFEKQLRVFEAAAKYVDIKLVQLMRLNVLASLQTRS